MTTAKLPLQSLPLRPASSSCTSSSLLRAPVKKVALSTCASPSGSVTLSVPVTSGELIVAQVGSDSCVIDGGVPEAPGSAGWPEHGFQLLGMWHFDVSTQPAAASAKSEAARRRTI